MALDKRGREKEKEKISMFQRKEGITRMPRNDKTIWQTSSYPAEVQTKYLFIFSIIFFFFFLMDEVKKEIHTVSLP